MLSVRTLEFDRIVESVTALALTPMGAERLRALEPSVEPVEVAEALAHTSETAAYLEGHALFPLRAATGLDEALGGLMVEGRPLEPLALRAVAEFLDSVDRTRGAIREAGAACPRLAAIVAALPSFGEEVAAVRRAIDPSGDVLDEASPTLRSIRDQLRHKRQKLRGTLEQFVKGRETTKYLQEQVITERNGRYVLVVRAEHRGNVPGIVHGSSTSGASLFLEPAATVEINNDIVELEEREKAEIFRILLELTDRFRHRPDEVDACIEAAAAIDVLQAKARYSARVRGVEPRFALDGAIVLSDARHPLLAEPVPIEVRVDPPARVLLITGPNTGGKTVALKTAGLFVLMAQSGLHVPATEAVLPVFRSVFADIGDEQSISASLSTFSAHITNIVSMDRDMALPCLVLLDEVGTGTDPNEGGALATAIVNHFRQRGAHVIATTHYDALKTWGTGTEGVTTAAFAFDPQTFAPTYRLIYGAPGRSLAIEIARRLGMPLPVVAAARGFLSDDQKRLAAHLERVDAQARALESERSRLQRDRRALEDAQKAAAAREADLAEREARFTKRLGERLDDRVRQAKRDIDQVIAELRQKSDALVEQAAARTSGVSTGEAGATRAAATAAVDRIAASVRGDGPVSAGPAPTPDAPAGPPVVGARVAVGGLGLEGTIVAIQGAQADVDVRGKRMRSPLGNLRVLAAPAKAGSSQVRVNVDLKPRDGLLSELNVIGCTVDEATDRVSRFLDDTMVTDVREVRIVHGHGTGQLRRGLQKFLKDHPLVATVSVAPDTQGGGGATIVVLKD
ncbi:MAG: endonuclease MutS2 [Vicinamibacterales bacterium]